MIDIENHAMCENYSCEIRDFVTASIKLKLRDMWKLHLWKFEGFVNEVQCGGKRWQLLGLLEPRASKFYEIARS